MRGRYEHYKGGIYYVLGVALDAEETDSENKVVYHPFNNSRELYFRSIFNFTDTVICPTTKKRVKRFRFIE